MIDEKVKQRIFKCKQALGDALFNVNDGRYFTAVNRMYYSAFYIVTAYFAFKDWTVKTHSGVKTKLHLELTSKNLITSEEAKTYGLLFQKRGEFDYDDFVTFTRDEIVTLYERTNELVQKIESLITTNE